MGITVGAVDVNVVPVLGELAVFGFYGLDHEERQSGLKQKVEAGGGLAGTGHSGDKGVLFEVRLVQADGVVRVPSATVHDCAQLKRLGVIGGTQVDNEIHGPTPPDPFHLS